MLRDLEVLTTLETASFLRVHIETLRRLARRGEIPSFKVGKDWRFRKDSLLRWADKQQAPDGLVLSPGGDGEEKKKAHLSKRL